MSPWSQYNEAILAILAIVKKTVPLTGVQRRRIDEAEELVDAIIDIIAEHGVNAAGPVQAYIASLAEAVRTARKEIAA